MLISELFCLGPALEEAGVFDAMLDDVKRQKWKTVLNVMKICAGGNAYDRPLFFYACDRGKSETGGS